MQTFTSRPAPPAPRPRLHPALRELVVEASQALARLDADRLEELVLCCQALTREQALTQEPPRESALDSARESTRESTRALNRDLLPIKEAERLRLAAEARDARGDMAVFARVLEATRANVQVIERLRALRAGRLEYSERDGARWPSPLAGRGESRHGND
jgi:hypothetical protein